jgi:carboxypeptidase Taq
VARRTSASDFDLALPAFRELLKLVHEKASALGEALGLSPYNALLEQYDPGRRIADIEPVFADLRSFLSDTIPEIVERQKAWDNGRTIKVPVAAQREAAEGLLKSIGFDFDHGRLDDSLHPFSTGTPEDARITARWNPDDALTGMMAVLHEAGHATYTRGQPADWGGQPVGGDAGHDCA